MALEVNYSNSAHGTYVKRNGMPEAYAVGNCGHCHEQHGTIGDDEPDPGFTTPFAYLEFSGNAIPDGSSEYAQAGNFCFYCHCKTGATTVQEGGVNNVDYAATFGGYITGSPTGVLEAFNASGSRHDLKYIYEYVEGNGTYSQSADFPFFTAQSNTCIACHNPHLARANRSDPTSQTLTVLSLPTEHDDLYGDGNDGDGSTERMSDFAGTKYQAPYYYASTSTFEPGGDTTQDGSNLPDYNTFCLSCHENRVPTFSHVNHLDGTTIDYIEAINWSVTGDYKIGDKHGRAIPKAVVTHSPYDIVSGGYILSCLDCHEPHGSPNSYLIRRMINGKSLGETVGIGDHDRGNQCRQCHKDDYALEANNPNGNLINSWKNTHHGGGDANPYVPTRHKVGETNVNDCAYCHGSANSSDTLFPIACENCHFHGSYVDENDKYTEAGQAAGVEYVKPDQEPYQRKTF
jgi:predicted CXXCH cytochrome family protein